MCFHDDVDGPNKLLNQSNTHGQWEFHTKNSESNQIKRFSFFEKKKRKIFWKEEEKNHADSIMLDQILHSIKIHLIWESDWVIGNYGLNE